MRKSLSVVAVILIATIAAAWPQHGTTKMPGGAHGVTGLDTAPASAAVSLYDGATAWYKFNDPTDLGLDSSGNGLDLTEVNTPTATGGALGYSADFEVGSSQFADNTSANFHAADTDFSVCAWVRPESLAANMSIAGAYADWLIRVQTDGKVTSFLNNTDTTFDSTSAMSAGVRYFSCTAFNDNGTGTVISYFLNGAADGGDTTALRVTDATTGWAVSAIGEASNQYWDGLIGPVYVYAATAISEANATTLYNGGLGMSCADADAAVSGLSHCYGMTEDGGPYADSIGSNDLTGNNTPTRGAALVEQPESGMSAFFVEASSQHLADSDWDISQTVLTVSWWWNQVEETGVKSILSAYTSRFDIRALCRTASNDNIQLTTYDGGWSTVTMDWAERCTSGQWNLGTVIWDSENDIGYVCMNDECDEVAVDDPLSPATNAVYISRSATIYYDGAIDDVVLFTEAKDPDWVTSVYNSGAGVFYAAVLDWMFDNPMFPWSKPPQIRRVS